MARAVRRVPEPCRMLVVMLALAGAAEAQQATIYVKKGNMNPGADGTTWTLAWPELADAFDPTKGDAKAGDIVWVSRGTYEPDPVGLDRTKTFRVPHDVQVYGGFAGTEEFFQDRVGLFASTILTGDLDGVPSDRSTDSYHVVMVRVDAGATTHVEDVVVDGFTIQYGNANGGGDLDKGGGLLAHREAGTNHRVRYLRVRNCTFTENQARLGAGAYIEGADPNSTNPKVAAMMTLCVFDSNEATSTVNPVVRGGALYLHDNDRFRAFNSVFRDNVSSGEGGAVWFGLPSFNKTDFFNCLFHDNEATRGGAFYLEQESSWLRIRNCTLTQNSASIAGGAIYLLDFIAGAPSDRHEVYNCVVWGNTAPTGPSITGGPSDWMDDFIVDHTDIEGGWTGAGANNIDQDPFFEDPGMNIFKLGPGSPCIEVGLDAHIISDLADLDGDMVTNEDVPYDIRIGFKRSADELQTPPAQAIVDMGCYERQVVPVQ